MKKIRVKNRKVDVFVTTDYKYVAQDDYPLLGIKKGDNFKVFYINNRMEYDFIPLNYYEDPYAQEDKLTILLRKNPLLQALIDEYELEVT